MNIIYINGNELHSKEDLHQLLQDQLRLGEHYGRNLDALWDALTGEVAMPLSVRWSHVEKSKASLGEYAEQIIELMREAEEELEGFTLVLES